MDPIVPIQLFELKCSQCLTERQRGTNFSVTQETLADARLSRKILATVTNPLAFKCYRKTFFMDLQQVSI